MSCPMHLSTTTCSFAAASPDRRLDRPDSITTASSPPRSWRPSHTVALASAPISRSSRLNAWGTASSAIPHAEASAESAMLEGVRTLATSSNVSPSGLATNERVTSTGNAVTDFTARAASRTNPISNGSADSSSTAIGNWSLQVGRNLSRVAMGLAIPAKWHSLRNDSTVSTMEANNR